MKEGEFVRIDYTGRIKSTGEVFDTTKEDVARKGNIFNSKLRYSPIPVIIGAGFLIKGLEKALREMEVGEKKIVIVKPEEGFGERREELVKLLPIALFERSNVKPIPGNYVTINNLKGKIVSVNGGRVKIDFNHPLAGKELEYEIEIREIITEPLEKAKAIVEQFIGFNNVKVRVSEKGVEIIMHRVNLGELVRQRISDTILKWIPEFEKVKFVNIYSR